MEAILTLDGNILLFIQNHIRNPLLTPFMKAITHLGDHGMFWIALTLILLCFRKTRKIGLCALFALLGSYVIDNLILKNLVNRIRPYEVVEGLQLIVAKAKDASFPSGHTGTGIATALAVALNVPKKYGIPLMILAVVISLSRLYVGIHYPTDVLAGAVIGILLGLFGSWAGRKVSEARGI